MDISGPVLTTYIALCASMEFYPYFLLASSDVSSTRIGLNISIDTTIYPYYHCVSKFIGHAAITSQFSNLIFYYWPGLSKSFASKV